MSEEGRSLVALLALVAAALLPLLVLRPRPRGLVSPRVLFPVVYMILTGGPTLWWLATGWYYAGVVRWQAAPALLSCATAILGFHVGAWLVERSRTKPVSRGPARDETVVRDFSHLAAMTAVVLLALVAWRLRATAGLIDKSLLLEMGDPVLVRLYALSAAAVLAVGLVFAAADARINPGRLSGRAGLLFGGFGLVCLWSGERDVAFLVLGWMLCHGRSLGLRRALAAGAVVAVFVAVVPLLRGGGLDASSQAGLAGRIRPVHVAGALMTQTSSNFYVYTNVLDWVPDWEAHRHGRTYLMSLRSFFPWDAEARAFSLADWFRDRYAPASTSGYGFSMESEAYLNFGWLGPPLVFCLWGLLLAAMHRRAATSASSYATFLYALALIASFYAVRMHSRVLLKLIVNGAVGAALLHAFCGLDFWRRRLGARGSEAAT